jgi:hypothetical protein
MVTWEREIPSKFNRIMTVEVLKERKKERKKERET